MPFESLSERLQMTVRRLTGRAVLTEKDIDDMMREVRLSLLEADVNYKVVKKFTSDIKEKALGEKILKSLTPGDMVVKLVLDELKMLMGEEAQGISYNIGKMTVIMLAGLQGAGKTTHCGKLANYLRKKDGKKPMLIAGDIYRPAAINQLVQVGKQIGVEVFEMGTNYKVTEIVKNGLEYAKSKGYDLVIIDTAGRLHINEELMVELEEVSKIAKPDEILLTIDSMMGQDSINVITTFNERLKLTGCILTKLDGDTRGGAALSIRYLTNVPIKFMGVGEKIDQLEVFHPERMAKRILGMGDLVSLVEKATDSIDEEEATKLMERIQKGVYDYNDYLKQLKWIKKMGSIKGILSLIPGLGQQIKNLDIDEKKFEYVKVIIMSMTKQERKYPDLLDKSPSRRERIAKGSGRPYQEVNALVKQFNEMKKQMKAFSGISEEDLAKGKIPQNMMQRPQKQKKGKGKGKGGFRF